jgi:phosphatidyl-myo-inositol dimannoside synthase
MRIAHVGIELVPAANGAFVGGLVKNVATVGRAQKARGDDVHLFTTDIRGQFEDRLEAAHGTIRTIETKGTYGSVLFASTFMARVAKALRNVHAERPFDVVHVHTAYGAFATLGYLLRGLNARKVFSLYSPNLRTVPGHDCNGASSLGGETLSRHAMARFDAIVVPSRNLQARLLSVGLRPDAVVRIPPTLDPSFSEPMSAREDARRQLGLSNDRPIVLFVGNYSPWKGVEVLLRAIAGLRGAGTDAILMTAWGEPYAWSGNRRASVVALLEQLGLGPAVVQQGVVPDIRLLLRAADVMVSPFLCTCKVLDLPLSILEAMACETPVIGTAVGGIPELLDGGERGVVLPPGDAAVLADALQTILSNPERARSMGTAGKTWVRTRMHVPTILARLDAVYAAAPKRGGPKTLLAEPAPLEVRP